MDCSTPGFPVHHHFWELIQTHVHRVGDAIQPSHPLLSPSPPAFNLSQHQGIFKWVSSSHQVAKELGVSASASFLSMNIQNWFPLDGLVASPCNPRDSQESLTTPEFKSITSLALSFLYSPTLTSTHDYWKNHSFDLTDLCWQMSLLFNMLSRLVIAFLPRSKCLLISWVQSPSAVILEPPKLNLSLFPHLLAMKWWDQMPWP